jgi:hypothetical protein
MCVLFESLAKLNQKPYFLFDTLEQEEKSLKRRKTETQKGEVKSYGRYLSLVRPTAARFLSNATWIKFRRLIDYSF